MERNEVLEILKQAVSVARWYYIDHKRLNDLQHLDAAIAEYKRIKEARR